MRRGILRTLSAVGWAASWPPICKENLAHAALSCNGATRRCIRYSHYRGCTASGGHPAVARRSVAGATRASGLSPGTGWPTPPCPKWIRFATPWSPRSHARGSRNPARRLGCGAPQTGGNSACASCLSACEHHVPRPPGQKVGVGAPDWTKLITGAGIQVRGENFYAFPPQQDDDPSIDVTRGWQRSATRALDDFGDRAL